MLTTNTTIEALVNKAGQMTIVSVCEQPALSTEVFVWKKFGKI